MTDQNSFKNWKYNYVSIAVQFEFLNYYKPEMFVNVGTIKNFENYRNFEYKKLTNELELIKDLDN